MLKREMKSLNSSQLLTLGSEKQGTGIIFQYLVFFGYDVIKIIDSYFDYGIICV